MLHQVSVGEWAGFLFLHLDPNPSETLTEYLGELPALFSNWKLETSVSGDRMRKVIDCNWKIFWENFSECYHCPGHTSGTVPHCPPISKRHPPRQR